MGRALARPGAASPEDGAVRTLLRALLFALAAAPNCKGCFTTHFDQVPVSGVLSCPPAAGNKSRWLVRPIVVDLTGGDAHIRRSFNGWSGQTRARTMSLPDGRRSWTARFGQCARTPASRRSAKVDWYATRTIEIDPAASGQSIVVPAPPSSECEGAAPAR